LSSKTHRCKSRRFEEFEHLPDYKTLSTLAKCFK